MACVTARQFYCRNVIAPLFGVDESVSACKLFTSKSEKSQACAPNGLFYIVKEGVSRTKRGSFIM